MTKCYYLVYKLKTSPLFWIVNVMDNPDYFFDYFKNVKSHEEKYYIIIKHVDNIERELDFKRFTIFKKDPNCHIVNETKLL